MPPTRKARAAPTTSTLGGLVDDSDEEDDLSAMSVTRPQSKPVVKKKAPAATKAKAKAKATADATEPEEFAPKKRGRLPATTTTASHATPSSTAASKVKKPTAKPSRPLGPRTIQALEDEVMADATPAAVRPAPKSTTATKRKKVAAPPIDEDETMDEAPEDMPERPKAKKGRIAKTAPEKAALEPEPVDELEPVRKPRTRTVRKARPAPEPELEPEPEDVEMEEAEEQDIITAASEQPPTPPPVTRKVPASVARGMKRVTAHDAQTVLSETTANRQLAEMKKKYDNLEAMYNSLRKIGIQEAQNNYDKLKKNNEERLKSSEALIDQLKEELAHQTELAQEGEALRAELDQSEAVAEELQSKVAELGRLLKESRAENRGLTMKLAASRTGDSVNGVASTSNGTRTASANPELVQAAHMKAELYSDLTGLYVLGVKRVGGEDVFDCLLSVNEWTLHFKLSIDQNGGTGAGSGDYEEPTFTYRPQLDENRDEALIERLPEYLTDEIQFVRSSSGKFYARVMKALATERN